MKELIVVLVLVSSAAMAQGYVPRTSTGGSTGGCGVTQSCAAVGYEATTTADGGVGYSCNAALGHCVELGPGSCTNIGSNSNGYITVGEGCNPVVDIGNGNTRIQPGQVSVTNGAFTAYNSVFRDLTTGYLQLVNRLELQADTLGPCPRVDGTMPVVLVSGTGADSGVATRWCACITNGDGNGFWRNILAGTDGTNTTCPDWLP